MPFDFVKLPDGECSMNVSTSSCQYSGSLVFATISEDVQPGSLFELYILGAFTIPLADRTGQFEVIITYKGRTID